MSKCSRSVTTTLSKFWLQTSPPLSAPMSLRSCVAHSPACESAGLISTALSTASSAIFLYVVHFPPQIDTSPPRTRSTTWSLASFLVSLGSAPGARTRGRSPAHAARTWLWFMGRESVLLHSSSMKSTSLRVQCGCTDSSSLMSVVPAIVLPSHGRRYSTRPSCVNHTHPILSGEKWSGMMRCEPFAGTMISFTSGSAILRIVSAKGPVALITCLALISHVSPVNLSLTLAPVMA
mmetsp:Transcript_55934/g.137091  ORF Transcript_55934/g.137091 Transcript_55934/m.137091 type:complete len:235 (+) Transcript_55934:673-1377(+)